VRTATSRPPSSGAIVVDHRSVALFESIPETYLTAARNLRMLFSDRSVGQNINLALNCLSSSSWAQSPVYCRRDYYGTQTSTWLWKAYGASDLQAGTVPARILFTPDPVRYSRANWSFEFRMGGWEELLANFSTDLVPRYAASKDVLGFQFSYLNIDAGSDIASLQTGFFVDHPHNGYYPNRERWDISDLRALEAQYPGKTFIYWTTSLARGIGTAEGTAFNDQMRAYALQYNRVLFDVADILSRNDQGALCYDNRDGVAFSNGSASENYPNDGVQTVALCQDYTTETDGGHLGAVSAGQIRVAKAFWVLMARIAGWQP
jgi:hypothetical protein